MIGFIQILGGLALFLYGIQLLSSGMEKLAGEQIQKWLNRVTTNRFKGAAFGAVSTALIQSSGLLMVTMIGLINANLMTVQQAICVMLGQEIGTTLTAQIVAFEIGDYRLILVILGFLFLEFFPNRDWRKYGEIAMGLGVIFVGMSFMSHALDSLVDIPWFMNLLVYMGQHPLAGVLVGIVLTSLTQSSTAVTSMTVAMGISQVITIEGAVGIILGANIGSCITGLIAALRLSRSAKRASIAQISINVLGVLLFLPFISQFSELITHTSTELPRQIANAHTIFNLTVSILLFPFVKQIAQFTERVIPASTEVEKPKLTAYIDKMQFSVPAVALSEAARELTRLGEATAGMIKDSCSALIDMDTSLAERVITQEENFVDPIFHSLVDFVDQLIQGDLSISQKKRCFQIKNLLTDIERVADLSEDIAGYAIERKERGIPFTPQGMEELETAWKMAQDIYSLSIIAFSASDRELAREVCRKESEFDKVYWNIRQSHIARLEAGECHPEADVIFTETMRALERISDHADNLGVSVARSGEA